MTSLVDPIKMKFEATAKMTPARKVSTCAARRGPVGEGQLEREMKEPARRVSSVSCGGRAHEPLG